MQLQSPQKRVWNVKALLVWLILFCILGPVHVLIAQDVSEEYRTYFELYNPRDWKEDLLNRIGLSGESVGRSFALVAGVSDYSGSENDLPPAAEDIRKVVSYLKDVELFDEVVVLENEALTYERLRYFLRIYFPDQLKKSPRSRFLFAYSGHGNEEAGEGYILLSNAENMQDKINSLDMGVIRNLVDFSLREAHQSLVLFNACHSGVFLQRAFGGDDFKGLLPTEPGAHVITASGTREPAYHLAQLGTGSVFFEVFLSGVLEGKADLYPENGDGIIQVNELNAYLEQEVNRVSPRQHPQSGDISVHGSAGGFFFVHRERTVTGAFQRELGPQSSFGESSSGGTSNVADAVLVIISTEGGAVYVNGEPKGQVDPQNALRLPVPPGTYNVEVRTDLKQFQNSVSVQLGDHIIYANFDDWRNWPRTITSEIGLTFGIISPGQFTMGDNKGPESVLPEHRVEISEPFYMSTTEVTQAQWDIVMENNPSHFTGADLPVENVSWDDAQRFISALNSFTGCINCYRLPTEAEWEYAARAGTTTPFSFGDRKSNVEDYGWYRNNSDNSTQPVGQKLPNAWGLYDMHGNVWEWVNDWYGPYDSRSVRDPQGPGIGTMRVTRGGSWLTSPQDALVTTRSSVPSDTRVNSVGIRLVRLLLSKNEVSQPVPYFEREDELTQIDSVMVNGNQNINNDIPASNPEDRSVYPEEDTNDIGMSLILIEPGVFMMGASNGEDDERPSHDVVISKHFYMSATEVTQAQWEIVLGEQPSVNKGNPDLPVENVSWEDTQRFMAALNQKEGCGNCYRLPTEAEWEYATRAGSLTSFTFGNNPDDLGRYAWYWGNANNQSNPVGKKLPNAWGLYDMHGNVWEWVNDWYGPYSQDAGRDPGGPETGETRVIRGGSWSFRQDSEHLRSANRASVPATHSAHNIGFRVVKTIF